MENNLVPVVHNCPSCGGAIAKNIDKCNFCESPIEWRTEAPKINPGVNYSIGEFRDIWVKSMLGVQMHNPVSSGALIYIE